MFTRRSVVLRALFGFAAVALLSAGVLSAQEKSAKNKKGDDDRRLPPHYAKVVNPEQREKIYGILESYAPKLEELEAKLAALKAESDAAMRAVLSADQQKKLDGHIAAAKAKRASKKKEEAAAAKNSASTTPARNGATSATASR